MLAREELLSRKHIWLEERRKEGVEGVYKAQALALPLPPSLHDAILVPRAPRAVIPRVDRRSLETLAGGRVDIGDHVRRLTDLGASAVMISTDNVVYGGGFEDVLAAAQASPIPVICCDYVLDTVQVAMARAHGAAAVMLSAELLDDRALRTLYRTAADLRLDVMLDVTSTRQVEIAERLRNGGSGALVYGADLLSLAEQDTRRLLDRLAPAVPDHGIAMACVDDACPTRITELESAGYEVFVINGSVNDLAELERQMNRATGSA